MKLFESIGGCYCDTESNGGTTLKDLGNRIFSGKVKKFSYEQWLIVKNRQKYLGKK